MKSTELRIGNRINIHNRVEIVRSIYHNGDIQTDRYITSVDNNINIPSGIPLTEEWLIKLGFTKEDIHDEGGFVDYRYELEKGVQYFVSLWASENLDIVNHVNSSTDLEYLHQLQNLYYALCGEELIMKE